MKLSIICAPIAVAMSGKSKCGKCPMKWEPHCGIIYNGDKVPLSNECHAKYHICAFAEDNLPPFKKIIKGECPE